MQIVVVLDLDLSIVLVDGWKRVRVLLLAARRSRHDRRQVVRRVGGARRRAGGAGDGVGEGTVLMRVERSGLLLLLLLGSVVLQGGDVEWWRRGHGATREGCWSGQQVVPVSVGAIGEASGFFVFKFTPSSGIGTVGLATIGIIWGEFGGSTTDVWSEELSRTILELSAQLDEVLSKTGILLFEFADAIQRTHFIVREAHSCLKPCDCLLELFDVGLSLCSMTSLGLRIPATLALVLGGERSARGSVGSGHCQCYVVRGGRHHVRQSRKMNRRKSGLDLRCLCEVVRSGRRRRGTIERMEGGWSRETVQTERGLRRKSRLEE